MNKPLSFPRRLPQVEVTAPYGGVVGMVYLGNASSSSNTTVLTGWTFCQLRSTQPTPLGGAASTARRSAREVPPGFDEAAAADAAAAGRLLLGGRVGQEAFSFSTRRPSPEEAAAAAARSAELTAAAEAAAAENGPRDSSLESLAFLEGEIAKLVGAGKQLAGLASRQKAAGAAAEGRGAVAGSTAAAGPSRAPTWPDMTDLRSALASAASAPAEAASVWSNDTLARDTRGRDLRDQLASLVHFDLTGSGRGVTVDGTVSAVDAGTVRLPRPRRASLPPVRFTCQTCLCGGLTSLSLSPSPPPTPRAFALFIQTTAIPQHCPPLLRPSPTVQMT